MKMEVNQEEAILVGSSYVVSAPVNLGNYSVNFFYPLTCFMLKVWLNEKILALGMEC